MRLAINVIKVLRAFGFTVAYFGMMVWAIHTFGKNVLGETGPDEFSDRMICYSGIGLALGLLTVLILKRIKPRC